VRGHSRVLDGTASHVSTENLESIPGKGITAVSGNERYFAGGYRFINENGIPPDESIMRLAAEWEEEARSIVYFADSKRLLAVISVSDPLRPTSGDAVRKLEEMGIRVFMVTGDNEKTAASVARKTGIKEYRAGMLPSDKAAFISDLQARGLVAGMVGDGINDSQALATADISIAMGKGSDIAIDASKMTIISSDLSVIPSALKLSRKTVRTIRQNLFWAFIYNIIGIPLAAGILYPVNGFLLNPMIAGLAMALSSVSVVSNSLRLKYTE
ncbi:MAG: HAD-IC family P-type ATPase, partial [Bacteroidales bacterium]|nr:HAD-IC family P-type ATPase [Bacteroidales bacterium]